MVKYKPSKHLVKLANLKESDIPPVARPDFRETFTGLLYYLEEMQNPEHGRTGCHYLFQGVYDLVHNFDESETSQFEYIFHRIVRTCKKYFKSYYEGEPDLDIIREMLTSLAFLKGFDEHYKFKQRVNFDSYSSDNLIDVKRVAAFLKEGIAINFDIIVCIACAGFEPSATLSAFTDIPLNFIRYSKRRYDSNVTCLSFLEQDLRNTVKGNNVLIIDDCIQFGTSMNNCMDYIQSLGATKIMGASINSCSTPDNTKKLITKQDFYLYEKE